MIEERFWNIEHKQFQIPKFECPICQKGLLISDDGQDKEQITSSSASLFDITMNENDYEGLFTSITRCNNPDCCEIVVIAGETRLRYSGKSNSYFQNHDKSYIVKYTNPPIKIFNVPENTPPELTDIIDESFKLFWIDTNSCGNKVRSAIEKLLDILKVKKTSIDKNKKRFYLSLHQRIRIFGEKDSNISSRLLALKWIGNQGSHSKEPLGRKELIDAFNILQSCLTYLYDKNNIEINRLTAKINKRKKHKVK